MSDYLRARIDALEREVAMLRKRTEELEAKLEVQEQNAFQIQHENLNYQQSNTLQQ